MLIRDAYLTIGGSTSASKMSAGVECLAFDPRQCHTGSKMRKKKGTICREGCYGFDGCCRFSTTKIAEARRMDAYREADPAEYQAAFVRILGDGRRERMRWFTDGDLADAAMLRIIKAIAERTPDTRHWLPTKERGWLIAFERRNVWPDNVCARLSLPGINQKVPMSVSDRPISTVHTDPSVYPDAHICPAYEQDGTCGDCDACWNREVLHVSYPFHKNGRKVAA